MQEHPLIRKLLDKYSLGEGILPDEATWRSFLSELTQGVQELELKTSAMAQVVEKMPAAVFCKDCTDNYRFTVWNSKCEEIFSLPRSVILGKTDFDFFPKEEAEHFRRTDIALAESKTGEIVIPEEVVSSPGAKPVIVRTRKTVVKSPDGKPLLLIGASVDITEQKLLEKANEEQRAILIAASKMAALGEMAGGVAHEINNPLTVIQGKSELLIQKLKRGWGAEHRAEMIEDLNKIWETSERIAKIVRGLRAFSRSADDDPRELAQIGRIIADTVALCSQRFKHAGVELTISAIPEISVLCSATQILQVILNLLNNAFDAVSALDTKWIRIDIETSAKEIQIHVTDSGSGIPAEVAGRLMTPFFTTKSAGKGTGLGLSISNKIIQNHGGRLIYDPESANTRFIVRLPLDSSAPLV